VAPSALQGGFFFILCDSISGARAILELWGEPDRKRIGIAIDLDRANAL
jgi:hypothetical protein